jgi:ribosome-associated protein
LQPYLPGGLPITTTSATPVADTSAAYKFALAAAEMAANTRAENVVLLDLRDRSPVTEFFILATGTSPRQMRTAAEEIQELGKRMGFKAWHTTGQESAKWILVDCVNVVAHFFDSDSRDFYDLELLWGDCPRIDWRKELGLPPVTEEPKGIRTRINFTDATGLDDMDAEEEGGSQIGDEDDDDDDLDEDDDSDASVMIELPDESTGSNSVEFVEVDPPNKRRKRGRSIYPTVIEDEDTTEEERGMNRIVDLGGRSQSTDEDDAERAAESEAADNVEAVSKEDLPRKRIRTQPIGGVSAGMSDPSIGNTEKPRSPKPRTPAPKRAKAKAKPAAKAAAPKKAASKKKVTKKAAPKAALRKTVKKAPAAKSTVKKLPAKKPVAKKKALAKKAKRK